MDAKGWVDYVAPQLYLEIGHDKIAYEKILIGGVSIVTAGIYIGHGIYRGYEKTKPENPEESNQIKLLRQYSTVQEVFISAAIHLTITRMAGMILFRIIITGRLL